MTLGPRIPKFEDGEFLTEAELYQLAWLPLELYRMSSLARGYTGFFRPEALEGRIWNRFTKEYDELTIDNLFVISSDGVPFILTRPRSLNLSEVTIGWNTLYASAYFAMNSKAQKSEGFLANEDSDEYDAHEDDFEIDVEIDDEFATRGDSHGADRAPNAYQVLLHWGEDGENSAPDIAGTRRFTVALGRLENLDEGLATAVFHPTPLAYYRDALPELEDRTTALRDTLDDYIRLLLDPDRAPWEDRSTLLDRLERLVDGLMGDYTPMSRIVGDALLAIRSARGFFLRSAFNPQDPRYRQFARLTGRVLEKQLEGEFERIGALGQLLDDFDQILEEVPTTGQGQIEFLRQLVELFDFDRTAEVMRDLRPSPVEPEPPPDSEPVRRRTPRKKILPLE